MAAPKLGGNEWSVEELFQPSKEGREQYSLSSLERSNFFYKRDLASRKPPREEFTKKLEKWARDASNFLIYTAEDIELALKTQKWDKHILRGVLALMVYLLDCCGIWDDLAFAVAEKTQIVPNPGSSEANAKTEDKESEDVKIVLKLGGFKANTEDEYEGFINHLKENHSMEISDLESIIHDTASGDQRIPTASLRELYFFNEAYAQRDEIWSEVNNAIRSVNSDNIEGEKIGGEIVNADIQFDKVTQIFENILKQLRPSTPVSYDDMSWRSRTIAIALDTENGTILAGGTKIKCDQSELFRKIARGINLLRIGEEFPDILLEPNKDFAERARKAKEHRDLNDKTAFENYPGAEELDTYEEIVKAPKSDSEKKIVSSTADTTILNWLFDGTNFEFKPPCLRCQRFYSTWRLYDMPCNASKRKKALEDIDKPHLVPLEPSPTHWNYCAESIIASKLYALHN